MKRIVTLIITLIALAACTAAPPTQVAPEPAATDTPQAGLPNPASVYCTQRGNKLETFGIDSLNPAVSAKIVALRDSGKIVHLWGTLLSNVPDVNGSQVQVDRIEVEE